MNLISTYGGSGNLAPMGIHACPVLSLGLHEALFVLKKLATIAPTTTRVELLDLARALCLVSLEVMVRNQSHLTLVCRVRFEPAISLRLCRPPYEHVKTIAFQASHVAGLVQIGSLSDSHSKR